MSDPHNHWECKHIKGPTPQEVRGVDILAAFVREPPINDDPDYLEVRECCRRGLAWLVKNVRELHDKLHDQDQIIDDLNMRCNSLEAIVSSCKINEYMSAGDKK